jgi:fructokinase
VRFSSEARTALAFVSLPEDGEREFLFYRSPSADMLMRPEDVDSGTIRAARVFHFGSISLIADPSRASTPHAVRAREAGLLVTYDPNLRLALWPDAEAARQGIRLGLARRMSSRSATRSLPS